MLLFLFYQCGWYLLLKLSILPFKVSLHLWKEEMGISSQPPQQSLEWPRPVQGNLSPGNAEVKPGKHKLQL